MSPLQKFVAGILCVAIMGLIAWHVNSGTGVAGMNSGGLSLTFDNKQTIVEGTYQISPPALQFDQSGAIHVAWFDKQGDTSGLRALRLGPEGKASVSPVQVNPAASQPDALHQSPGLAVGINGDVFITWSAPRRTPEAPFATALQLSPSHDGGMTFAPPVIVNDDGAGINHSFEHVNTGPDGAVYLGWLDNRNKDKSGAGAIFACSRDGGKTVEKNVTIDAMACPCCRPMSAVAPDGTLWISWRKTFDGNVRDIVLAKSTDQGRTFSAPILVQKDDWAFPACPHRGPSIAFDRSGRLYVAWYTEGTDEQPRILFATSDDQGKTFSPAVSLHNSTTSLPDQLRMAVHPDGIVLAVWEEVTGVRKRVVMRISSDRGRTFEPVRALSDGAKSEYPDVAISHAGAFAITWTEHAWPNNRIVLQRARIDLEGLKKDTREK